MNQLDGFNLTRASRSRSTATSTPRPRSGTSSSSGFPRASASLEDDGCDDDDEVVEGGATCRPRVGIDQVVWDPATRTLHAGPRRAARAPRYAVVVTRGVRDSNGSRMAPAASSRSFRHELCAGRRRDALVPPAAAPGGVGCASAAGGPATWDIAAVSCSTRRARRTSGRGSATRSSRRRRRAGRLRPRAGRRAARSTRSQRRGGDVRPPGPTAPALSPEAGQLLPLRFVPGAVGTVAFGRYTGPRLPGPPGRVTSRPSRRARARRRRRHADRSTSTSTCPRPAAGGRLAGRDRRPRPRGHKNLLTLGTSSWFARARRRRRRDQRRRPRLRPARHADAPAR